MMKQIGSLGELLREIRTSQHISQQQVALQAGIARSTLLHWERGTHQPRLPELQAVLDTLGASPTQRAQALTFLDAPRATYHLKQGSLRGAAEAAYTPATGDLLRAIRMRQHLTQEQVATQMGIRHTTLSRWESGELLPSKERLEQLLTLLCAHPQEREALMQARIHPFLTTNESDMTLDALENHLHLLAYGDYDVALEALKDLEYLRLEANLSQIALKRPSVRGLLVNTYCFHAQWLGNNGRYREAESYTQRVLEARDKECYSEDNWLRTGIIAAHAAVYSGTHPKPEQGVELLQQLLCLIPPPVYSAWIYADIAHFWKLARRLEVALDFSSRACQLAWLCDNPMELQLRRIDRAEILLQTGLPQDAMSALDLLPIGGGTDPRGRVREALLWAEGFFCVGEGSEAQRWLENAYAIIQEYNLDPRQANALAKKF